MRVLFPVCVLYLLIVTACMVSIRIPLQTSVKQQYIDLYLEKISAERDSIANSGKCAVNTDESSGEKSSVNEKSDNKCLSSTQVTSIKTALLTAQPVYPLNPEILDTTLSICNPRRGICF